MKKILSLIVTFVMALSFTTACSAAETDETTAAETPVKAENFTLTMQIGNPTMTVNGTEKPIDAEGSVPVVINDRTLLPVRTVVEEMGDKVEWDEAAEGVTLTHKDNVIKMNIGSEHVTLNGVEHTLDTAPALINDRTMLPIRFIAESFGFTVSWAEETQTVTITAPEESKQTESPTAENNGKRLVVYFSATGSTEKVANYIAEEIGADVFKIEPTEEYTSADLDWTNSDSRVSREHNNESERNVALKTTIVPDWESYDTVFIGYPIWWGIAAWPTESFVAANNFEGKTIIPFCTSASSGIGSSAEELKTAAGTGTWTEGKRFSSGEVESAVREWAASVVK